MKSLFLLFILFTAYSYVNADSYVKPKVLLINSYKYNSSWTSKITAEISNKLGNDCDLIVEYLDSKRFYSEGYFAETAGYFGYKYSNYNLKLILVTDNDAYNFIIKYKDKLFGGIPAVFAGVSGYKEEQLAGHQDITGVTERVIFEETLQLAMDQNQDAADVYVVVDNTTSGRIFRELAERTIKSFNEKINLEFLSDYAYPDLIKKVSQIKSGFIIYHPVSKDGLGNPLDFDEAAKTIIRASSVPVYTFWSMFIEDGATGGYVVSPEVHGAKCADIALRILNGEDVRTIKVDNSDYGNYMFNYKSVTRYDIKPSLIPENSIIINKPLPLYKSNPILFYSIIIISSMVMCIIFLLVYIALRIKMENTFLEEKIRERTKFIERQQRHIMNTEKTASLGGLVSGVAHEINTPLGVSVTTASFLQKTNADFEKLYYSGEMTQVSIIEFIDRVKECTEMLNINLTRASELIKSFKKIAVDQSCESITDFDMFNYINTILTSLKHEYKNTDHRFEINCPRNLVLESYPGVFSQIFTNLIMNALIHGLKGIAHGVVSITVSYENEILNISFKDSGRGIEESHLEKIFEPFFTTNRQNGGSGLGLHIVYNLVTQKLKGTIICRSKVGDGAEFIITAPVKRILI